MEKQIQYYEDKLKYEIDSWDLSESLKNKEKVIVIDARSIDAYNHEHIPSAINIPHRTMDEQTTKNLDKEYLYVCYCDGIGCNASTKGALNMTKLGFKTKELLGGLDWWKRDGYETSIKKGTNINCGC
ncbi:MAG: rhodanese [Arcobacter sp.]|nr:MAG: rhodanese [Arcobacter sp.]